MTCQLQIAKLSVSTTSANEVVREVEVDRQVRNVLLREKIIARAGGVPGTCFDASKDICACIRVHT